MSIMLLTTIVSINQNTLYISDSGNSSVTSMDLDGNVQHVYTHDELVFPYGVAVDREDTMYIAAWGSDSIHINPPQCTPIRILQDGTPGMKRPYAVIYCKRDNRLYISHFHGSCYKTVSIYQIE